MTALGTRPTTDSLVDDLAAHVPALAGTVLECSCGATLVDPQPERLPMPWSAHVVGQLEVARSVDQVIGVERALAEWEATEALAHRRGWSLGLPYAKVIATLRRALAVEQ